MRDTLRFPARGCAPLHSHSFCISGGTQRLLAAILDRAGEEFVSEE